MRAIAPTTTSTRSVKGASRSTPTDGSSDRAENAMTAVTRPGAASIWAWIVSGLLSLAACQGATRDPEHGSDAGQGTAGAAPEDASDPAGFGAPGGTGGDGAGAGESDPQGEPLIELPSGPERYLEGTEGWIALEVTEVRYGSARLWTWFWGEAQFYERPGSSVDYGRLLDPDEGVDDCSVSQPSGDGAGDIPWFRTVGEAFLIDGQDRLAFSKDFSPWRNYLDLTALGREPRHGGLYGFEATGGSLPKPISIDGIELPASLSVTALATSRRLEREQRLMWTGADGEGVLDLYMNIRTRMADSPGASDLFEVRCRMLDDGEFTIGANVFDAIPENGIVRMYWTRQARAVASSEGHDFLTIGEARVEQELAFGDGCDRPDVLAACEQYANYEEGEYERCGLSDEAPPRALVCPDYLAESCIACVEYFECRRAVTRCEGGTVVSSAECACP